MKPILISFFLLSAAQANPDAQCADLKATVQRVREGAPAVADGTFQPFTPPPLPARAHVVSLAGNTLYLPVAPYRCSISGTGARASVLFIDRASSTLVMVGPMEGGTPMEDVFGMVGDGPAPPDRVAMTKRMFGKAPDVFDIEEIGWTVDASKFQCTPETVDRARRDSIALILKTLAAPGVVTAHKDVGFQPSHLMRRTLSDRSVIDYHWRSGPKPWTLNVSSKDPALVDAAAALVGVFGGKLGLELVPMPGLCASVVALVDAPTPKRAKALRAKAEAAGDDRLVEAIDFFTRSP